MVILFGLFMAWGPLSSWIWYDLLGNPVPEPEVTETTTPPSGPPRGTNVTPSVTAANPNPGVAASTNAAQAAVHPVEAVTPGPMRNGNLLALLPGAMATNQIIVLSNKQMQVDLTRMGACIAHAVLYNYKAENRPGSGPVEFWYTNRAAMAVNGLQGVGPGDAFEVKVVEPGKRVVFTRDIGNNVTFTRDITLTDNYQLDVVERFANGGGVAMKVPSYGVTLGTLPQLDTTRTFGMANPLGVSGRLQSIKFMKYNAGKIAKMPRDKQGNISQVMRDQFAWVAAKNKFFTSVLTLDVAHHALNRGVEVWARSGAEAKELQEVSADFLFASEEVAPGEARERHYDFYIGPKKHSVLARMKPYFTQDKVMEFGILRPICIVLLKAMNFFESIVRNYGLAIILLTVLVRVLFWPLMAKSSANMKKMAALAPQIKEINEKHKDDYQKKSQLTMELYRKHKVNPMKGCLPILIQMPVLLSLFFVIRSAIELRFAKFLWIDDLSEPEGLFQDTLGVPVNILPILMGTDNLAATEAYADLVRSESTHDHDDDATHFSCDLL